MHLYRNRFYESISSFSYVVYEMNFKFETHKRKKYALIERQGIIAWRGNYFHEMKG